MKLKLIGIALALLCFMAGSVFGSVVGKITGKITDADSQELLVGVTVSVQGTTMGAITDEDGVYTILNVPVGTYTLAVSAVGFAGVEISNVQVSADLVTYQDIAMSSRAEDIGTTISVVAERPMVLRDKIASVQIVTAEELQALPTRGFEAVVGIQSGVVAAIQTIRQTRGNRERSNQPELYVRGGRPSEVAFYVDGFSQQDPLTGLSTGNTGNNAIKE
ncbi:MAG: carboxypeptidase-like regulatory domain-containing protein, partial [candidate division Zixibacteria bacterium]|nr:carboxypeptidase-like regulatory domain-containing protein [candidate division Zixibacteria bacterium]